jgi:uncharacterized membrane-anchored protein
MVAVVVAVVVTVVVAVVAEAFELASLVRELAYWTTFQHFKPLGNVLLVVTLGVQPLKDILGHYASYARLGCQTACHVSRLGSAGLKVAVDGCKRGAVKAFPR